LVWPRSYRAVDGAGGNYSINGKAALKADFASNTIGTITDINATRIIDQFQYTLQPAGKSNDILLTGGTITGTSFVGTAKPADVIPGGNGPAVNITGVSGSFAGAFYGPGAAEAAGSLSMSGPGTNVIAAFGAAK
jgi:C-lobe and N-lobe beta barrels of Tf-binding protein B